MRQKWISVCDAMPPFDEWIYVKLAASYRHAKPKKQKAFILGYTSSATFFDSVKLEYCDEGGVIKESTVCLFDIIGWQHIDDEEGGPKQWP